MLSTLFGAQDQVEHPDSCRWLRSATDPKLSVDLRSNAGWRVPGGCGIYVNVFLLIRQERCIKCAQRCRNPVGKLTLERDQNKVEPHSYGRRLRCVGLDTVCAAKYSQLAAQNAAVRSKCGSVASEEKHIWMEFVVLGISGPALRVLLRR